MNRDHVLYAFILALAALAAVVILTALGHPVPEFVTSIGYGAFGTAAGLAVPALQTSTTSTDPAGAVSSTTTQVVAAPAADVAPADEGL